MVRPWNHNCAQIRPDADQNAGIFVDFGPEAPVMRFFARHLKGELPDYQREEPPVRIYVMGDNVWREAGFIKNKAAKVLMLPGPSWYGQVLFNSTFKTPKGRIAAAAPLKFADDTTNYTGNVGGGLWFVSSHSKNLKAASDLVTWMTTSNDYQATAGTYPAYKTAATAWLANQTRTGYFADDIGPVFQHPAGPPPSTARRRSTPRPSSPLSTRGRR
ncbi:hypothetical protein [Streptomyces sp. MBT62]|uniref:hypothetical protein n=1 Tax=Streptomyces sp. MBT62 TaxID=2800410 RepID=UPI00190ACDF2|nr:hypothetical protein [Streptomyces sp. MBT62]MBK3565671.1 hypothetical protein [Streptomyces sp. MBT62]